MMSEKNKKIEKAKNHIAIAIALLYEVESKTGADLSTPIRNLEDVQIFEIDRYLLTE